MIIDLRPGAVNHNLGEASRWSEERYSQDFINVVCRYVSGVLGNSQPISIEDAAKSYGLTFSALQRHLARHNLPRHPRGPIRA